MDINKLYQIYTKFPKVVTDSREVKKCCIFFGLQGENFNGNRFAGEAIERGAEYAVIDKKEYAIPGKTILVTNVLKTLQDLASLHRKKLGIPVLAITGTNGKTTTKELIAAVLSKKSDILSTTGNLNNHIGLPLTLLKMTSNKKLAVVEMGANHPGEIEALCKIADPDYGIITNIGYAHLEGFGSFEKVKETKAELYKYIKRKNGVIFYNYNNDILRQLIEGYENKISYGTEKADLTGKSLPSSPFINVRINFPQGSIDITTKLTGSYNFENLMAAACIGNFFKVTPEDIADAVSDYTPLNNRSQLIEKVELKIVMDAYNANPDSMKVAINSFVAGFTNSRCLILGDMLELGSFADKEHYGILKKIQDNTFKEVYLIGPVFSKVAQNFSYKTFPDVEKFCAYLINNPINYCSVLIKGSRGIHLEKVLEFL
ncbi:MAG: UDP-N-acetylmuramoyl-tripeptide--D-alanyl-D-alanine ligase [Prolixibacteraceae bacterium]|nr:UDP-N-acetylmuramoyl-tripeptide--D-alanyl-D-alanine ligase [Prolixibacteraceae bacterium]